MSDSLLLFYRDIDIFLNNLFLGGFTTVDHHSLREIDVLIKTGKGLGLEFLEGKLSLFSTKLEKLYQSGKEQSSPDEVIELFTLLVEYINISLQEFSIYEVGMRY